MILDYLSKYPKASSDTMTITWYSSPIPMTPPWYSVNPAVAPPPGSGLSIIRRKKNPNDGHTSQHNVQHHQKCNGICSWMQKQASSSWPSNAPTPSALPLLNLSIHNHKPERPCTPITLPQKVSLLLQCAKSYQNHPICASTGCVATSIKESST